MSIELGEKYLDQPTGIVGVATELNFKLGGAPLAKIEYRNSGDRKELWVPAGRLESFVEKENGNVL